MKGQTHLWASAAGLMFVILSVPAALAAPSAQGQAETPTPTETETATPTETPTVPSNLTPTATINPNLPTPTLLPVPAGGGRVSVGVLYVRDAASFDGRIIGSLGYNTQVFPIGRNADATWVAIEWNQTTGWIFAGLVAWDPGLSLNSLPVLSGPAGETAVPSASPTVPETPSPAPSPSPTPAAETPSATPPPATATPTPEPTSIAASEASATPAGVVESSDSTRSIQLPAGIAPLLGAGGGLIVLIGGVYGWRRVIGEREVRRYAKGFVLRFCPACREGHLHLDETVQRSMGIARVRRLVRCDNCRSILREIRPGQWRYTVDPMVNKRMAKEYDERHLTQRDLAEMAETIDEELSVGEKPPAEAPPVELDDADLSIDEATAGGEKEDDEAGKTES